MFKKTAVIVIAITVIISCCCFSASAATVSGLSDAVVVSVNEYGTAVFYLPEVDNFDGYWANCLYIPEPLEGKMYLRTKVNFTLNYANVFKWDSFRFSLWSDGTHPTVLSNLSFVLMDDNYNTLATLYEYDYSNSSFIGVEHFDFPSGSLSTVSTIDVKYIALAFDFSTQSNTTLKYHLNNVVYNVSVIDSATAEQEKTNEKLDELLQQPEQEKNEANSTGNDGVGELTGVIPDYSTGFIDGMQKLATSLSYNGTECKWTFPQLYIPAMEGVTPEIPLTDGEWEIDIGSWVQKLPPTILKIIQIVLTVALILYCVKELYDTVQYALTLKSGGAA